MKKCKGRLTTQRALEYVSRKVFLTRLGLRYMIQRWCR